MRVVLVGTSHRHAPVELRERMGFGSELGRELAQALAHVDAEAVALSTCNRVCLYLAHTDARTAQARALAELSRLAGLPEHELAGSLYTKLDEEAAQHLFRVAGGLDSMVPGEAQILGQVRAAYERARDAGSTGPFLHRLFDQALRVGKRVRTETAIGENPASVSSAAAELAARVFDDLEKRQLLLIGAGKMGGHTAVNLMSRGVRSLVVANRTAERGATLAQRFGGRAVGLDDLEAEVGAADIVVACTGSPDFVLGAEEVERALSARRGRPIFFIDIAVPRDLDPAINALDSCYLYDIDDLERVVTGSLAGRRKEAARAEAIVAEEADAFQAWQRSLDVIPAITSLRRHAEEIRTAELERVRPRLEALSPRERRTVESLTAQIVNKLLHSPTIRLKEAAAAADGRTDADALRRLFDLADDEQGRAQPGGGEVDEDR